MRGGWLGCGRDRPCSVSLWLPLHQNSLQSVHCLTTNIRSSTFSKIRNWSLDRSIALFGPGTMCNRLKGHRTWLATCIFPTSFGGRGPETWILRAFGAMVGRGFYALATVWGPLAGGEGEGGTLKAAPMSHSLVAPRGDWRIWMFGFFLRFF